MGHLPLDVQKQATEPPENTHRRLLSHVLIYLGFWVEFKKTCVHNKKQIGSEIKNDIYESGPSSALQFWTAVAAIFLFFLAFH